MMATARKESQRVGTAKMIQGPVRDQKAAAMAATEKMSEKIRNMERFACRGA